MRPRWLLPFWRATNRGALPSADWTTFNSKVGGSGTAGQVAYFTGSSSVGGSNNLFWDNANGRLGVGTSSLTASTKFTLAGFETASSNIAKGLSVIPVLTASANNDVLLGLEINPFYVNGAFTGVNNVALRIGNTLPSTIATQTIVQSASIVGVSIKNTSSSSGTVQGGFYAENNQGFFTAITKNGSGATAYKIQSPSDANIYNNGSGDISILNDFSTGAIKFAAGGSSTAQMRIFSNGNVGINQNTDAGFRLDVNGTARVQGTELRLDNGTTGVINLYSNTPRINFISNNAYYIQRNNTAMEIVSAGSIELLINNNTGYSFNVASQHVFRTGTTGSAEIARLTTNGMQIGGTGAPVASAQLEVLSTTRGFLQPRMTTAQRDLIASPATGLSVYNTTTNTNDFYNGTAWVSQGSASGASGQVAYFSAANALTSSATFAFTPTSQLLVNNSVTAASAIARGVNLTTTLVAAANNDFNKGWGQNLS